MKKNRTLVDAASAKCIDNHLFYSLKNGSLFFNDDKIFDNVESHSYWFKEPYIYLHDNNGNHVLLNIITKSHQILDCGLVWFTISDNKSLCSYDVEISGSECTWKTGLFDLEKLSIIDEITKLKNTSIAFYLNDLFWICYLKNNRLGGFSNDSGTYLWETDLSEYCKILSVSNEPAQGMIRQVLGVWGDKLWVGFDGNQYASIDLSTGKVLQYFKLEDIDEIFQEVNALSPYFDGNKGLLCFLENRIYAEISLNTLRVERKKSFVTDNTETDWNFSSNTFSESHVYFVANKASSRFSPNYVGVFDRVTMEVVWSEDLELYKLPPVKNMPARFLAQAPQSDGNKLYVLDTHGTLHIFEKTEDN